MNSVRDYYDENAFDYKTDKTYNKKGDMIYQSQWKVSHLGSYTGRASRIELAEENALKQIYQRLNDLYNLIRSLIPRRK